MTKDTDVLGGEAGEMGDVSAKPEKRSALVSHFQGPTNGGIHLVVLSFIDGAWTVTEDAIWRGETWPPLELEQ